MRPATGFFWGILNIGGRDIFCALMVGKTVILFVLPHPPVSLVNDDKGRKEMEKIPIQNERLSVQ